MKVVSSCVTSAVLALAVATSNAVTGAEIEYGVDLSFPMHHGNVSTNYPWLPHNVDPTIETPEEYKDMPIQPLGNKMEFYENYIKGCATQSDKKNMESRCRSSDDSRVRMMLRQPKGMYNYTETGYTKIRAPEKVFNLIKEFWEANKDKQTDEAWSPSNIYVNHWEAEFFMVNVGDSKLEGGGGILKQAIWNAARDTIQEWTGQQLAECSLYGVRVYKEGAVLAPHVDRLPLVSSAIINVDQDVDEPWPLEVIGHDGKAVNITMEPGDLVLYESHSIIHGRPFPLKGRYMANIFVHFEPVGKVGEPVHLKPDLPNYVIPGSEEAANWKRSNPRGYSIQNSAFATGTTAAHQAAQIGDSSLVRKLLTNDPAMLHAKDNNGWQPIHEATRNGHVDAVKTLVELGADINARTNHGQVADNGGSPLWWAERTLGPDHELVHFLKKMGARNIAPGNEL
eukprot:CAMPEP_0119548182 /NCGR_PEP_ID=MMETSP1352-20130426/2155_1 /TAXON_ID=265584 /ORGANISM="Stauroneis constricta, Strain CCMP1120" /LENGTH=452 /DNA_ID=CAMNT_0007593371 /DNA_START=91 /DNA_END=1449 /DNA_ORIENTATION=-